MSEPCRRHRRCCALTADRSRPGLDARGARAGAPRKVRAGHARRVLPGADRRHRRRHGRCRDARSARRSRSWPSTRPATASSPTRSARTGSPRSASTSFIRPMKTVGVVRAFPRRRVIEIAEPFGVVAAIVPTTNPTSTAIYKILIALKARCAIVISPHPSAIKCISRVAGDHGSRRRAAPARPTAPSPACRR